MSSKKLTAGHTAIGIVQLLTLGGCGIWMLVDLIIIITKGSRRVIKNG